jgi:hypothetical protein
MPKKQIALRMEEKLLTEIEEFREFFNETSSFSTQSRTAIMTYLMKLGLKEAYRKLQDGDTP